MRDDQSTVERLEAELARLRARAEAAERTAAEASRSARELAEAAERHAALFEGASDAIVIMSDGRFVEANRRAYDLFGCGPEGLLGRTPGEFSPTHQPDGTNSERGAWERMAAAADQPQYFEWVHVRADGTPFYAEVSLNLVRLPSGDRIQAIVRDVSARKRAERARQAAEAQLTILAFALEQIPHEVILVGPDRRISYVNPAFERTTGWSRAEAEGQPAPFPEPEPGEVQAIQAVFETVRREGHWRGRAWTRRKDGRRMLTEGTLSVIRGEAGDRLGWVAIRRDVTREAAVEQRLAEAHKMEALGTLAGGIAHDFNNILAAIKGTLSVTRLELPEGSTAQEDLDVALGAADRARDLVRQILTFSRRGPQARQPVQLARLTREVLRLVRASLPAQVEIRSELRSAARVEANPVQMHQVLMNLCTNAGLAMPDGGLLTIEVDDVDVEVDEAERLGLSRPGPYLRLRVSDTGRGMPEEVRERVFEPFFTTRAEGEGTGMGLAVVHGIVNGHAGAIAVQSAPGEGTTFSVWMPALEAAAQEGAVQEAVPRGSERILVVDDEEIQVTLLERLLGGLGYEVVGAVRPDDALARFAQDPDRWDLVLSDTTMPGMPGDVLARRLREIRPELPIILSTGYSPRLDAALLDELNIHEVLSKPWDLSTLARVIRRALDGAG